jgi:epsilon-lactone hydrolase
MNLCQVWSTVARTILLKQERQQMRVADLYVVGFLTQDRTVREQRGDGMSDSQPVLQGVFVEAHEVPPPRSISPEAQAFLSAAAAPLPKPAPPALDDKEGWKAYVIDRYRSFPVRGGSAAGGIGPEIKSETTALGGVPIYVSAPPTVADDDRACLDFHGGAFILGGGELCRFTGMIMAQRVGVRTYSVDYRMPPDHPYPAPLDDSVSAYRALLDRYAPDRIVVAGRSAGGNLAAALMLRARDEGLPLPAGLVLLSPEVDLTESGDSFQTNRDVDVVLRGGVPEENTLYAGGHDLAHPYLSPLFGDFTKGFPRTFLQAGTRDLFLSNAVRMHRALRKARVEVELHIFEAMPHGGFFGAPEDLELEAEMQRFVEECWRQSRSG